MGGNCANCDFFFKKDIKSKTYHRYSLETKVSKDSTLTARDILSFDSTEALPFVAKVRQGWFLCATCFRKVADMHKYRKSVEDFWERTKPGTFMMHYKPNKSTTKPEVKRRKLFERKPSFNSFKKTVRRPTKWDPIICNIMHRKYAAAFRGLYNATPGTRRHFRRLVSKLIWREINSLQKNEDFPLFKDCTAENLSRFTWEETLEVMQQEAPIALSVLCCLVSQRESQKDSMLRKTINLKTSIGIALAILLYGRYPRKASFFPTMLSIQLWQGGLRKETFDQLSGVKLSLGYNRTVATIHKLGEAFNYRAKTLNKEIDMESTNVLSLTNCQSRDDDLQLAINNSGFNPTDEDEVGFDISDENTSISDGSSFISEEDLEDEEEYEEENEETETEFPDYMGNSDSDTDEETALSLDEKMSNVLLNKNMSQVPMKSFVKFDVQDGKQGKTCYLLTDYQDDGKSGFKLTLIDNQQVWKGKVLADDLDTMRLKIKMDLGTFTRQTLQALTNNETYDIKFNYQIIRKLDDDEVELVWKKHVPVEDITFQLGKVVLHRSAMPGNMISEVLDHCIECAKSQKAEIDMLKTDNSRLSQERINALKRLEKCVVAKEDLERELYSKFAAILNSKKEKIRDLKESVGIAVDHSNTGPGPSSDVSQSRKRSTIPITHSDDDGDTTDDEKPTQKVKRLKTNVSVDEDSLVLDDGSDGDKHTVVARPKRTRETTRRTPNSKPVLPKVSSKDSNSSISERPSSARKSKVPSGNASSTADIDADAMLDEI